MDLFRDEHKRKGLIGTIIVHLLLLILFTFYGLTHVVPTPEQGILINFGTSEEGFGEIAPEEVGTPTEPVEKPVEDVPIETPQEVATEAVEKVVTQETTETIHVPTEEELREEKRKKEEAERKKKEEEAIQKNRDIWNKVKSNTPGDSQGNGDKTGDQGDPAGDREATSQSGSGGGGKGVSFSLSNRSILSVPPIVDNSQDEGKVVVDIIVDRRGKVIKATPGGKGSTTTSPHLFRKAKDAALKTEFSQNPDAPEEQRGQMTFVFILE